MPFNPTVSQKNAIITDGSVLVTAAAGSGKTAVLTERVIRKLTDKNSPVMANELLIVTFTNAAAEEMKSRIEKRLFDECRNNPDDTFLIKQKHLLQSSDICTIDSFCINLVRENFEKCGVEPNFTVGDGNDMKAECGLVLEKLLDAQLEKSEEAYKKLLELTSCEYNDQPLKELIEEIYLYSMQMPFPDKFLDALVLPYNLPFDNAHPWVSGVISLAKDYLKKAQNSLTAMGDTVPNLEKGADKADIYVRTIAQMLYIIQEALNGGDYENIRKAVYETVITRIPTLSKEDSFADVFRKEKEKLKDTVDKLYDMFAFTKEENEKQIKDARESVELLISLVKEYNKETFSLFCEENKLAFYHTEQLAFSLLCEMDEDGNICVKDDAKQYIAKYREVLVDEYQDVNDLQNMLFEVLSDNKKNLFVVGDIKQSIYRFRGSNPENFLKKKNSYIAIENSKDGDEKKITLSDNFRSRKGVCDFVNFFFSKIMTEKTGDLVYNEEEYLNASAYFPKTTEVNTELLLIDGEDREEMSLLELEASTVANRIKELVENKTQIKESEEKTRDIKYSDICILLDKIKNKAVCYYKALADLDIPVSYASESFCDTIEISLALSLLSVIDNPANDIALLTLLMSPIFGFTPEDMAIMRANCKKGDIYKTVLVSAKSGDEKAKGFLRKMSEFRRQCGVMPLDKFLLKTLYDTNLISIVSALSDGEQRRNNLMKLVSLSRDMGNLNIGEFVNNIYNSYSQIKSNGGNANGVKIMTMHSSKGLQFPVCIVANLSSTINKDDSISRILYNKDFGIAFKYFDNTKKETCEMLGRRVISKKVFAENLSEKKRLLYVALTRAEEKLILVSANKNTESTVCRVAENIVNGEIDSDFIKSVTTMNDWIIAACLLHKNGEILRNFTDKTIPVSTFESELSVSFTTKQKEEKSEDKKEKSEDIDIDLLNKIKTACDFSYPYAELSEISAKTSVSAVSKGDIKDEYLFEEKPSFMSENGMTYAERGTATHKVMQYIKFSENTDINSEIDRLYEYEFINEQEKECVETDKIKAFFNSDVYKRIINSKMYKREMRFLTTLPASRIKADISEDLKDEPITVQGAVDLVFEEEDGLVVLDFKTDRTKDENTFVKRYGEQLEIYSKACEEIFGKRVKENIIYSFYLSKEIPVPLERF